MREYRDRNSLRIEVPGAPTLGSPGGGEGPETETKKERRGKEEIPGSVEFCKSSEGSCWKQRVIGSVRAAGSRSRNMRTDHQIPPSGSWLRPCQ